MSKNERIGIIIAGILIVSIIMGVTMYSAIQHGKLREVINQSIINRGDSYIIKCE